MQVLTFFLFVNNSIFLRACIVKIVVGGNGSVDKSDIAYDWGPQNSMFAKGVRKAAVSQRRRREATCSKRKGSRSKKFGSLCSKGKDFYPVFKVPFFYLGPGVCKQFDPPLPHNPASGEAGFNFIFMSDEQLCCALFRNKQN